MLPIYVVLLILAVGVPQAVLNSIDFNFTCTGDGYFPNPTNCSEYFVCTPNGAHRYVCPPNYIYNVAKTACTQNAGDCSILKCVTAHEFLVHPGNKAYYAYCSVVDCVAETIMFRCENSGTHIFNRKTLQCEFECRSEGRFPRPNNCQEFYECYRNGNELTSWIKSCVENYVFDLVTKLCVPGTCI